MNWTTTILSASEMSDDGDVTLEAQTEFVFDGSDFYSTLPGYERIDEEVTDGVEKILSNRGISFLLRPDVYPEYALAAPDLERHPSSWGRLIWRTVIEANVDSQEQVDSLIGLSHYGTSWRMPPF